MSSRYYEPGRDGKWASMVPPTTYKQALKRIAVLEAALAFYSDARSYNPDSQDNETPAYGELMADAGLWARIGRLSPDKDTFAKWVAYCHHSGEGI